LDYDLGKFQIATNGQQNAGNVIGELYVHYEIILMKPILPDPLGGTKYAVVTLITPATANPLGVSTPTTVSNIRDFLCNANNNTVSWPADANSTWIVMWLYQGQTAVACNQPTLTAINSTLGDFQPGMFDNGSKQAPTDGQLSPGTIKGIWWSNLFVVGDEAATVGFTVGTDGTIPTNTPAGSMYICQVSLGFTNAYASVDEKLLHPILSDEKEFSTMVDIMGGEKNFINSMADDILRRDSRLSRIDALTIAMRGMKVGVDRRGRVKLANEKVDQDDEKEDIVKVSDMSASTLFSAAIAKATKK